jgi:hypothetical protein
MISPIVSAADDDPRFIAGASRLVLGLIQTSSPPVVRLIRIDNWFDHKWLRFSGKGRVAFNWGVRVPDTALDAMWQTALTLPPFSPGRVAAEQSFHRSENGDYAESKDTPPLHGLVRQHSARNLQRRLADLYPPGLFLWFSSRSFASRRASLLSYLTPASGGHAWYASFHADSEGWHVGQTKGVQHARITALFEGPSN